MNLPYYKLWRHSNEKLIQFTSFTQLIINIGKAKSTNPYLHLSNFKLQTNAPSALLDIHIDLLRLLLGRFAGSIWRF